MSEVFVVPTLLLNLALAVVLIRKYLRTRDVGFVWLGLAVVIWPLLSGSLGRTLVDGIVTKRYLSAAIERGQITTGSAVFMIGSAGQLIGTALLLVAVFYLCRKPTSSSSPSEAHAQ
jgi:hypothetical protein